MTWNKTVISEEFLSESCCLGDIDGDTKLELVAGKYIWKIHDNPIEAIKIRELQNTWLPDWPHPHLRKGSGKPQYINSTYDFLAHIKYILTENMRSMRNKS